jgi:hypothetical protein
MYGAAYCVIIDDVAMLPHRVPDILRRLNHTDRITAA